MCVHNKYIEGVNIFGRYGMKFCIQNFIPYRPALGAE